MCLAIPGKIIEIINDANELKIAKVDFGGVIQDVCVEYIEEPVIGEYVIVHTGMAINKLDEDEAKETLRLFKELSDFNSNVQMNS